MVRWSAPLSPQARKETKGWGHHVGDRDCRGTDEPWGVRAASPEPPVLPAGLFLRLTAGRCTASSSADSWLKEAFGEADKTNLENLPLLLPKGIIETQVWTVSWLPFLPEAGPAEDREGMGAQGMEAAGAPRQAEAEQVRAVTANLQALGTMWPLTHSQ